MDFDFDDLEEAEPAALAQVTPMSEVEFRRLRSRLATAVSERRFEDFSEAVAEAIWDDETVADRMPKVVKTFLSLLDDAAKSSPPDVEAGSAIVYLLWQLGLSTSMQETRVRRSDKSGAPTALVTGFGGSNVADLEGQAAWYHSQGFNVVSTSRVGFPPVLKQKHDVIVARELQSLLTEDGGVVFHLCSQYGVTYGVEILWMWALNLPPYDQLPPADKCLKAVVFDCATPNNYDPVSQTIMFPTDRASIEAMLGMSLNQEPVQEKEEDDQQEPAPPQPGKEASDEKEPPRAELDQSELHKYEDRFYLSVLLGCTGALTKKHHLTSLEEMVPANKEVKKCLMGGARYHRSLEAWVHKCQEKVQSNAPAHIFAALQWLDWAKREPFPRLFLCSEGDVLVTPDRAEAWARHHKKYRPEAKIFEAKMKTSAHCKLWETELEGCAAAVLKLLNAAGVPVSG